MNDRGSGKMGTKHNTKHEWRGKSKYRLRLSKRGLSRAPQLRPLNAMRAKVGLPPYPAPVK